MQFFLSFSPLDARRRFLEWKQETNQSYQTENRGNVIISNDHDDCFFHYRSFDTVVSIEKRKFSSARGRHDAKYPKLSLNQKHFSFFQGQIENSSFSLYKFMKGSRSVTFHILSLRNCFANISSIEWLISKLLSVVIA